MTVDTRPFTADELLRLPDDGFQYELVRGELRKMSPAGLEHGEIAARIAASLTTFVRQHRIGTVYIAEAGFRLREDPDTVRVPDVSFVRADRVVKTERFMPGPPDLAVEVVSPSDSFSEIAEKTAEYLGAGASAVIVVDPRTRTVNVYRAAAISVATDVLEVEDVIPGWKLPLREIFED
jgi:Uma2 family endonuclease